MENGNSTNAAESNPTPAVDVLAQLRALFDPANMTSELRDQAAQLLAGIMPSAPAGAVTMTAEVAAKLREPFPEGQVGKLPKVTCKHCTAAKRAGNRSCSSHGFSFCEVCRNWITEKHTHLDYVGHANVTSRLLSIDPMWAWEPMGFDNQGLPAFDQHGGLWITLTVAGVPRRGYGHADGSKGGDAVKEAIGDAIRNAAMRFGVGLQLWGASGEDDKLKVQDPTSDPGDEPGREQPTDQEWAQSTPVGAGRPPVQRQASAAAGSRLFQLAIPAIGEAQNIPDLAELLARIDGYANTGKLADHEARQLRFVLFVRAIAVGQTLTDLNSLGRNIDFYAETEALNAPDAGKLRLKLANALDIIGAATSAPAVRQATVPTSQGDEQ